MKQALITGGSGGIGQAICRALGQEGFHVFVHAHENIAKAEQVVEEIQLAGGSAQTLIFDVTDFAQTADALTAILAQQSIQVVVHAAGVHCDTPFVDLKKAQWDHVLNVSLNGFYHVIDPITPAMRQARWGRVIAIGSIAGILGSQGRIHYAAAKAGLHGACRSLANDVAAHGITVNAVAPGIIQANRPGAHPAQDLIEQCIPMQRAGRADEVAALVRFLASNDAAYITGQVISIDGGMA